jgi:hypothetical protein
MGDRTPPVETEPIDAAATAGQNAGQDASAKKSRLPKWLLRRRLIVNPRRQLRAAILVTVVALIPVIILNFSLGYTRALEREVIFGDAPIAVERQVWEHDRMEALLALAASFVYLIGVFALTVVETHQTSGAALGVARHLRLIRDGRYETRLGLRDSDNLQELTEPYNQMAIALQARSIRVTEALDELTAEAESLAGGAGIADRLREMAADETRFSGKDRSEG